MTWVSNHRENRAVSSMSNSTITAGAMSNQKSSSETFDMNDRTSKNSPQALHCTRCRRLAL